MKLYEANVSNWLSISNRAWWPAKDTGVKTQNDKVKISNMNGDLFDPEIANVEVENSHSDQWKGANFAVFGL